jgi:two-component system cell cycle response regulator
MTQDAEKIRLLIVEDDMDQRELIRETLEDHFGQGTVVGVDTIGQAMLQPVDEFDLILSDYNLPDGSGMELLERVQARCGTPVILVTGENVGQIAVEAIRKGATDYVVKIGDYLFTIPLCVQKNLAIAKIKQENQQLQEQLKQKNQQLEQMAATDPLTGLYNRRHFNRGLEHLFAEAQRYDKDLSAVMIDLDGYKQLNDKFGHQVGDQLLVLAGKVIGANMRRMDVAARYGGDEFVLLLPHASIEDAATAAERIREQFKQASASLLKMATGVSMSIGIASLRAHTAVGAEQLVGLADAALYAAKAAGRDRIQTGPSTIAKVA